MPQPRGALDGVKAVACSTAQAGTVPYMLMADLGAEVIKIEQPGVGDNSRKAGRIPGFPSFFFETPCVFKPADADALTDRLLLDAYGSPGDNARVSLLAGTQVIGTALGA